MHVRTTAFWTTTLEKCINPLILPLLHTPSFLSLSLSLSLSLLQRVLSFFLSKSIFFPAFFFYTHTHTHTHIYIYKYIYIYIFLIKVSFFVHFSFFFFYLLIFFFLFLLLCKFQARWVFGEYKTAFSPLALVGLRLPDDPIR